MIPFPKKDEEFLEHFGVHDMFQDRFLSAAMGRYVLDVLRLDSYMHTHYGYIEERDGSLKDFITKNFGQKATEFILSLFTLEKE